MLTRSRTHHLRHLTIQSLPFEIFSLIIGELGADLATGAEHARTLLKCALVHSQWKEISLAELYSDIEITTKVNFTQLSATPALRRYRTKSITFTTPLEADGLAWCEEFESILDACPEVEYLLLVNVIKLPRRVLFRDSLSNLKELLLLSSIFEDPLTDLDFTDKDIPFRIKKLITCLHPSLSFPLERIANAGLSGPTPTLVDLDIGSSLRFEPIEVLSNLASLAPTLQCFTFSLFDSPFGCSSTPSPELLDFLARAKSLKTLHIEQSYDTQDIFFNFSLALVPNYIRALLETIVSPRFKLELDIDPPFVFPEVMRMFDSLPDVVVRKLVKIGFSVVSEQELRARVWEASLQSLREKGVMVVPGDVKWAEQQES